MTSHEPADPMIASDERENGRSHNESDQPPALVIAFPRTDEPPIILAW